MSGGDSSLAPLEFATVQYHKISENRHTQTARQMFKRRRSIIFPFIPYVSAVESLRFDDRFTNRNRFNRTSHYDYYLLPVRTAFTLFHICFNNSSTFVRPNRSISFDS